MTQKIQLSTTWLKGKCTVDYPLKRKTASGILFKANHNRIRRAQLQLERVWGDLFPADYIVKYKNTLACKDETYPLIWHDHRTKSQQGYTYNHIKNAALISGEEQWKVVCGWTISVSLCTRQAPSSSHTAKSSFIWSVLYYLDSLIKSNTHIQ